MRFSGGVQGNKALAKVMDGVIEGYKKQYEANLTKAALLIHSDAIKSIRKTSAGEKQTRYGPKREVTVSKPGDAPNTDRGTAIQNIGWEIDVSSMTVEVGTGLKYLKELEFGTKNMKARPWLFPAVERVKKDLKEIFRHKPKIKVGKVG